MVQLANQATADRTRKMGARQIYEALKDQIVSRVYDTGGQLPSSRNLANELGVSRTTVTVAYEQLSAEGFVELRQGARPRVAALPFGQRLKAATRQQQSAQRLSAYGERLKATPPWLDYLPSSVMIDFRYGDLAPADFPALAWKKAVNAVIAQRPSRLAYDDPRDRCGCGKHCRGICGAPAHCGASWSKSSS